MDSENFKGFQVSETDVQGVAPGQNISVTPAANVPESKPAEITDIDDFLNDFDNAPAKLSSDTETDTSTGEIKNAIPKTENEPAQPQPSAAQISSEQEKIKEKWRMIMRVRFEWQAKGLAWYANAPEAVKEFEISPIEFELLVSAYESTGVDISDYMPAWFQILAIEGIVTGRMIRKASKMRKENVTKERQQINSDFKLKKQIIDTASEMQKRENEKPKESETEIPEFINGRNTTSKTHWYIDENSFFINDKKGRRIKQGDRKERPDIANDFVNELIKKYNP